MGSRQMESKTWEGESRQSVSELATFEKTLFSELQVGHLREVMCVAYCNYTGLLFCRTKSVGWLYKNLVLEVTSGLCSQICILW
jgi:hypothetical protein